MRSDYTVEKRVYRIQQFVNTEWETVYEIDEFNLSILEQKFKATERNNPKVRLVRHSFCKDEKSDWDDTLWIVDQDSRYCPF